MNQLNTIPIDSALLEAIKARANQDRVSPESWLKRQLAKPGQDVISTEDSQRGGSTEEVMLDLAWLHFRALNLDLDEARKLANAIFMTIETGDAQVVGPVSMLQRQNVFHRRTAAVSIRIGEGQIPLPIDAAMRLATGLYYGPAGLQAAARLAA
jgi:hypothetical protein